MESRMRAKRILEIIRMEPDVSSVIVRMVLGAKTGIGEDEKGDEISAAKETNIKERKINGPRNRRFTKRWKSTLRRTIKAGVEAANYPFATIDPNVSGG